MTESDSTTSDANSTTQPIRIPLGQAIVAVAPGGIPIQATESAEERLQKAEDAAHALASYTRSHPAQSYTNHLFLGSANWYRDNVHELKPDVLQRHYFDLEGKMALHEKGLLPLQESERMEIVEALKVISDRLDEVIPKVPAAIDEHDRNVGNRVHDNWPDYLKNSTLRVHLHFCELVDSWRIHPWRRSNGYVGVNEMDEARGVTAIDFDTREDLAAFVDRYQLDDFIVKKTQYEATNDITSHYLVLSNKFTNAEVNGFLDIYKSAINHLAIIAEERRRATHVDGGRVGFLSVDHFHYRETIELDRINSARCVLGAGPKFRETDSKE